MRYLPLDCFPYYQKLPKLRSWTIQVRCIATKKRNTWQNLLYRAFCENTLYNAFFADSKYISKYVSDVRSVSSWEASFCFDHIFIVNLLISFIFSGLFNSSEIRTVFFFSSEWRTRKRSKQTICWSWFVFSKHYRAPSI